MAPTELTTVGKGNLGDRETLKLLKSLMEKVDQIENNLNNLIRLEEKVNTHNKTLEKYGDTLDDLREKVHGLQLANARNEDSISSVSSSRELLVTLVAKFDNVENLLTKYDERIAHLEAAVSQANKDSSLTIKELLGKWWFLLVTFGAALIAVYLKGGK